MQFIMKVNTYLISPEFNSSDALFVNINYYCAHEKSNQIFVSIFLTESNLVLVFWVMPIQIKLIMLALVHVV